jgi:hypothetical protein
MLKINGTTITLTRGDTLLASLEISDAEGNTYTPSEGDVIRFAMKKSYSDSACLIEKQIPNDTLMLSLDPSDTKDLPFGSYVYDIEITFESGAVDTFIDKATFRISEEVE